MKKKVVLLVGSPKRKGGNSDLLGRYLLNKLDNETVDTELIRLSQTFKSGLETRDMINKITAADWLIFSFPNYMSSPPALMIKAMDCIYDSMHETSEVKPQRLMAICSGGYPETHSLETALDICRLYAKEAGFQWMGGIGIAGAAVLEDDHVSDPEGQSLEKKGFVVKKIIKVLDQAADTIMKKELHQTRIRHQLVKLSMPDWMYVMVGNRTLQATAKRHNIQGRIFEKPYEEPSRFYTD